MEKRKYSSKEVIVKSNIAFVQHNKLGNYMIDNPEELIGLIPIIKERILPFGCRSIPAFVEGVYKIKITFQMDGCISGGGYHTVATITI